MLITYDVLRVVRGWDCFSPSYLYLLYIKLIDMDLLLVLLCMDYFLGAILLSLLF